MGWVSGACGTPGEQKSIQPSTSAAVEAEQWGDEENNLSAFVRI